MFKTLIVACQAHKNLEPLTPLAEALMRVISMLSRPSFSDTNVDLLIEAIQELQQQYLELHNKLVVDQSGNPKPLRKLKFFILYRFAQAIREVGAPALTDTSSGEASHKEIKAPRTNNRHEHLSGQVFTQVGFKRARAAVRPTRQSRHRAAINEETMTFPTSSTLNNIRWTASPRTLNADEARLRASMEGAMDTAPAHIMHQFLGNLLNGGNPDKSVLVGAISDMHFRKTRRRGERNCLVGFNVQVCV